MTQPSSDTPNGQQTLPKLCLASIRENAKPDALNHKREGEWVNISGAEFIQRVRHIALGLS
ncbi:MAG TPA: hypothetical protein VGC64_02165, partial [Pyrinomonadaceae bacterium]